MLIMFLTFTLVLAYHAQLDKDQLWESHRLRRVTLAYLGESWLLSLQMAAELFSADG